MKLNTYPTLRRESRRGLPFLTRQTFGGKITMLMTHGQMPDSSSIDPAWRDKVLSLHASSSAELPFTPQDIPCTSFEPTRSADLSLSVDMHRRRLERIYALLSEQRRDFHAHGRARSFANRIRHVSGDTVQGLRGCSLTEKGLCHSVRVEERLGGTVTPQAMLLTMAQSVVLISADSFSKTRLPVVEGPEAIGASAPVAHAT